MTSSVDWNEQLNWAWVFQCPWNELRRDLSTTCQQVDCPKCPSCIRRYNIRCMGGAGLPVTRPGHHRMASPLCMKYQTREPSKVSRCRNVSCCCRYCVWVFYDANPFSVSPSPHPPLSQLLWNCCKILWTPLTPDKGCFHRLISDLTIESRIIHATRLSIRAHKFSPLKRSPPIIQVKWLRSMIGAYASDKCVSIYSSADDGLLY